MNDLLAGLPRELGDGLLLRWATADDMDELAAFNVRIHSDDPDRPEEWLGGWTRILMDGSHPTTAAADFTVVVDRNDGDRIVSTLCLISQTWAYDGVAFPVGRVELVGTEPAYRRRGLVRVQMDTIHARSAAKGELVQGITGIPWYYRMFGYDMALDLGGGREYFWARAGNDDTADEEPFQLVRATAADIDTLEALYPAHCIGSLVTRVRSRAEWHFDLRAIEGANSRDLYLIRTATGDVAAYVEFQQWGTGFTVREFGVRPGLSWRTVGLYLTRELMRRAISLNATRQKPITNVSFSLAPSHPLFAALDPDLEKQRRPYAWYVRVADLPAFLRHIQPVLEARLADSALAGYSGDLRLNLYRQQIRLAFQDGKLTAVGTYEPRDVEDGGAHFPDLVFLQLLFGRRSFDELTAAFADCYADSAVATVLLRILFPQRPSQVVML